MSLSPLIAASTAMGAAYQTSPVQPGQALSPAEQQQIRALRQRDADVRRHEQAHQAAAGGLAVGGASYTYQQGPDGQRKAIGGEVHISLSSGSTSEDTLHRARQMRAAALAPAAPSAQDRQVAQQASRLEQQAEREISRQKEALLSPSSSDTPPGPHKPGQYIDTYA